MQRSLVLGLAILLGIGGVPHVAARKSPLTFDGYQYGVVAGDAFDLLDAPEGGSVSIVAFGPGTFDECDATAFVVVNGTEEAVGEVDVTARLRDEDDDLIGSLEMALLEPGTLGPGDVGVVFGYAFGSDVVSLDPDEVRIEPQVAWGTPDESGYRGSPEIVELSRTDTAIAGIARNHLDGELSVLTFHAVCFDGDGTITQAVAAFPDSDTLSPGEETSVVFSEGQLDADLPCDAFLVSGSGVYVEE